MYYNEPKIIQSFKFSDHRGSLEKLIPTSMDEGFETKQVHIVRNLYSGTIRGMHHQKSPYLDKKIVKVLSGRIIDICVCVNPKSDNFGRCFRFEIVSNDDNFLYVPSDYAHGYEALEDNTSILYIHSNNYSDLSDNSFNVNDPLIGQLWSNNPAKILSTKDENLPYFNEAYGEAKNEM